MSTLTAGVSADAAGHRPVPAPALLLEGVRKVYPGRREVVAVDGIDLEVRAGELFGLLGPNGAGKSTTVGMCTTRIRPTAGRVTVAGYDVVRDPARAKRRLGVVTQSNTLDRSLTLRESLVLHCRYFGWPGRAARDRADELLERFRLADRRDALPGQISGGMVQRLQVARAIAHRPEVLFLDEPTTGLDPQSRLALWELLAELRADGLTVVLTTHHMEEAERLCDRVAVVDHGRVLVCDAPAQLRRDHGAGAVLELGLESPPTPELLARWQGLAAVSSVDRTASGVRIMARSEDGLVAGVVAATEGRGITGLSLSGSTLEAVFINLTGRELRE